MPSLNVRRLCLVASVPVALLFAACGPIDDDDDAAAETSDLSQCTPDSLDLYKDGRLTIATDSPAYDPWFADDDPSNGEGFESAVAYAIADRLGFDEDQVSWIDVPFNSSYQPGSKKFDFDINQISVTEERESAVTFSEPYYAASQGVVTMDDGEFASADSLAELKDAQLGAQVGTTSLAAIDEIDPKDDAQVYDDTNQATKALENGQIDALVADLPSAYYITSAVLDDASIAGQFQPETGESEEFALLFEKGNDLVSCVNAAIDDLDDDGTLDDIEEEWLSQVTDVPKFS